MNTNTTVMPNQDDSMTPGTSPALAKVRAGTLSEISDIRGFGEALLSDCERAGHMSHWATAGRDLWVGAYLHCLYSRESATVGDVLDLLSSRPIDELCGEMMTFDHAAGRDFYWSKDPRTGATVKTHPNVCSSFARLKTKGDNEKASIKANLAGKLADFVRLPLA